MNMNSVKRIWALGAVAALSGCAAEPVEPAPSDVAVQSGTTSQAVTVLDCQRDVATCTRAAKSFQDFGTCTTTFQSCAAQAARDLAGQSTLLVTCQAKANKCLQGAITVSDISACRGIFQVCTANVSTTANEVLATALKSAKDAITATSDIATGLISGAGGVVGGALDALGICENQASTCLKSAVTVGDLAPCRTAFDKCAGAAVKLVDSTVASLPVPTPTQVVASFAQCQAESTACLTGAVTVADVSACKGVLSTCVKNVSALADTVVTTASTVLPVKVPTPTQTLACGAALTDCLLKLGNPLDCTTQATACLTK